MQDDPPKPPHPPSTLGALILKGIIEHNLVTADSPGICVWAAQTEEVLEFIAINATRKAQIDMSGIVKPPVALYPDDITELLERMEDEMKMPPKSAEILRRHALRIMAENSEVA